MKKKVVGLMLLGVIALSGCGNRDDAIVKSAVENGITVSASSISGVEDLCNVKEDGTLWFVDTKKLGSDSLVIPKEINGRTVTSLNENVFSGDKTLKSIEVPETVTSVGSRCFEYCYKLEDIKCNSIVDLGNYNFFGCEGISELHLESLKTIGKWYFTHIGDCDIYLGSDLESIGENCFINTDKEIRIHVPQGSNSASVVKSYVEEAKLSGVNSEYYDNVSIIEE